MSLKRTKASTQTKLRYRPRNGRTGTTRHSLLRGIDISTLRTLHLETVRGRAQITFTTGLLLLGVVATFWRPVAQRDPVSVPAWVLLVVAILATLSGMLGALAVFILPVRTRALHPAEVTRFSPPVIREAAMDYAKMAPKLNALNGTLIDQLREATIYLVVGAACSAMLWAWFGH